VKQGTAATRRVRQAGMTLMELIVGGFLGLLLVLCGGYLFTTQVKGYLDIRDQTRIQADLKKAMQAVTRQISNAGACMPDPRKGFQAAPGRLSFAYVDIKGKFCDADTDTLTISIYSIEGIQADRLVQEIRCPGKAAQTRTLADVPGGMTLAFNYMDRAGVATMDVSKIKAVQMDLTLNTKKVAGRPGRTRTQSLQVELPNLL
jgi:Tfp pilus assembly protein PilW